MFTKLVVKVKACPGAARAPFLIGIDPLWFSGALTICLEQFSRVPWRLLHFKGSLRAGSTCLNSPVRKCWNSSTALPMIHAECLINAVFIVKWVFNIFHFIIIVKREVAGRFFNEMRRNAPVDVQNRNIYRYILAQAKLRNFYVKVYTVKREFFKGSLVE